MTDAYDYEVPPSKTMNLPMPVLRELSGFDPAPLVGEVSPHQDALLVASYDSESGHTIGVGELGTLFVLDQGDLGELGELGAIGRFKPLDKAKELLQRLRGPKQGRISTKIRKGGTIRKLVGNGGEFKNPADIIGATDIAAAWETESNHFVGMDSLGSLYVLDDESDDPELGKIKLGKAFKKVTKAVGKGVKAATKTVVSVAKEHGMSLLQAGAGLALTAATGGAAAPVLALAKGAKAASVAAKVAKVAKTAKAVKKALPPKKAAPPPPPQPEPKKVVAVAKKPSKPLPRKAVVPRTAVALSKNRKPLSFLPANPAQVQDYRPVPLNLSQQVEPAYESAYEPSYGPTIPLTPETADYADDTVATASLVEPGYESANYSQVSYDEQPAEDATYAVQYEEDQPAYGMQQYADSGEEMGALGALGISSPGVMIAGGAVLALGIYAIFQGSKSTPVKRRSSQGLAGTARRKSPARTGTSRKGGKGGKSRTIKL